MVQIQKKVEAVLLSFLNKLEEQNNIRAATLIITSKNQSSIKDEFSEVLVFTEMLSNAIFSGFLEE